MGLRNTLRLVNNTPRAADLVANAQAQGVNAAATLGIRSPWTNSALAPIIFDDVFGFVDRDNLPVSRADALTIPAVVRGVELITSTLADCPLVAVRGQNPGVTPDTLVDTQPYWLYATSTDVAPQYRMAVTIDDLIFYGWSLWQFTRSPAGTILDARHRRIEDWDIDEQTRVEIDGKPAQPGTYALIKGPHDGICSTGRRALRGALHVEQAWQRAIRNPNPTTLIKALDDIERTDDEVDALLDSWRNSRRDPEGAIAYVPSNLDVALGDQITSDLLTEARNASAVDTARLLGIPAVSIDAGPVQTSLTYANTEAANGMTLPLYGLAPYARHVGYALSIDSVTPRGTRIALDLSQLLADAATISRTGTQTED